jgi:hypothetical protein
VVKVRGQARRYRNTIYRCVVVHYGGVLGTFTLQGRRKLVIARPYEETQTRSRPVKHRPSETTLRSGSIGRPYQDTLVYSLFVARFARAKPSSFALQKDTIGRR